MSRPALPLAFAIVAALLMPLHARAAPGPNIGGPPTFSAPLDYDPELTGAQYVVAGDVMNRGVDDLVVTHSLDSYGHVSLLLGKGDGTFGRARIAFQGTVSEEVLQALLADVDGDGKLDLLIVTTDLAQAPFLTVALGDGTGRFHQVKRSAFSFGRLVVGKFGTDSLPDVFVQAAYALPAAIYRSDGTGGFSIVRLPYGGGAGGLVPVDVNHDGLVDLVGIGQGPSLARQEQLQTLFGVAGKKFFAPPRYTLPSLQESQSSGNNTGVTAAAGDLRNDGNADLVVFGADVQFGLTIAGTIYLGRPDGSYEPPLLLPLVSGGGFGVLGSGAGIADFNGDGIPDIFLTTAQQAPIKPLSSFVLVGVGDGTFPVELQAAVPVAPLYPHVVITDLNGDGRPDAVISDETSQRGIWVLLNTTPGRRSTP